MKAKRKRDQLAGFKRQWETVLDRVGWTPRRRLEWAVRATTADPEGRTPGDWDNLRRELGVFVGVGGSGGGAMSADDDPNDLDRPDETEARDVLGQLHKILQAVVKREDVALGGGVLNRSLMWNKRTERYTVVSFEERDDWGFRARAVLAHLLADHGHLVRACPARLPRSEAVCGNWFLAAKPWQTYCSSTCQQREKIRDFRARQPTTTKERSTR